MTTTRRARIDWTTVPLGVMPDADIAAQHGVRRQTVAYHRNRRGIAPASPLAPSTSPSSRRALLELEQALAALLDNTRLDLAIATATAVDLVPGWSVDVRRSGRHRVTRARFKTGSNRTWTEWMAPRRARTWLCTSGWADAAEQRASELRAMKDVEAQ